MSHTAQPRAVASEVLNSRFILSQWENFKLFAISYTCLVYLKKCELYLVFVIEEESIAFRVVGVIVGEDVDAVATFTHGAIRASDGPELSQVAILNRHPNKPGLK